MLYFIGVITLGIAVGAEVKPTYGFMVIGVGCIFAAMVNYLNGRKGRW